MREFMFAMAAMVVISLGASVALDSMYENPAGDAVRLSD